MATPKKDLSKEDEATLVEMFDYLCSKVNWGETNLDSTAVCCMNLLFIELSKQSEKVKLD